MNSAPLGGTLRLMPGGAGPHIVRERPQHLERLWVGQPAAALPGLVGALFTLCGHAHRLASELALEVARGARPRATASEPHCERLCDLTAREQARRVTLDWAVLTGLPRGPALAALRASPLLADVTTDCSDWLAHAILGMPATAWLDAVDRDSEPFLLDWCERHDTPPALALRACRDGLRAVAIDSASLQLRDSAAARERLATCLADPSAEAFVHAPHSVLGAVDTGAWSRAEDPRRASPQNAWMRMASRLIDLVRLGTRRAELDAGACRPARDEGLAWVETARGLLVHWVRLRGDRVAACQVLAPTDWNFHPHGGLARALARTDAVPLAELLVGVFDPCVAHRVHAAEAAHA